MKSATHTMLGSATLALFVGVIGAGALAAACADSSSDPIPNTGSSTSGADPTADAGGTATPAPTATSTSTPKACAPSCMQDSDCANSCGAISGAVWCCDVKMSQCYSTKAAACPAPLDPNADDGGMTAAY